VASGEGVGQALVIAGRKANPGINSSLENSISLMRKQRETQVPRPKSRWKDSEWKHQSID
jgi:hypothetical protein